MAAVLAGRVADRLGSGIRSAPRDALIAGSIDQPRRGAASALLGGLCWARLWPARHPSGTDSAPPARNAPTANPPPARDGISRQTRPHQEDAMRFGTFNFGSIQIDGVTYEHDVVIDGGSIRKRKKKPSRPFRDAYGHTPLSAAEDIPWHCRRLVIGTGAHGGLPIMEEVEREAQARQVELLVVPTPRAIDELARTGKETNAILHVTC
jgi:hypothetical protein